MNVSESRLEAQDLNKQGELLLKAGNLAQAESKFQAAIDVDPMVMDSYKNYGDLCIALTDVLARLNAERAELANGVKSEHPALVAFTKHQNIDQLSRELLVELIDHIKVYENGNISVRFKFADEFRRIAEYIEINTTKPAVAG